MTVTARCVLSPSGFSLLAHSSANHTCLDVEHNRLAFWVSVGMASRNSRHCPYPERKGDGGGRKPGMTGTKVHCEWRQWAVS